VRMNRPMQPDEGAAEPLMLVAALAVAGWLGFLVYGETKAVAAPPAVAAQIFKLPQPPSATDHSAAADMPALPADDGPHRLRRIFPVASNSSVALTIPLGTR
jgi:hypothetical protein